MTIEEYIGLLGGALSLAARQGHLGTPDGAEIVLSIEAATEILKLLGELKSARGEQKHETGQKSYHSPFGDIPPIL